MVELKKIFITTKLVTKKEMSKTKPLCENCYFAHWRVGKGKYGCTYFRGDGVVVSSRGVCKEHTYRDLSGRIAELKETGKYRKGIKEK
jgi:hypothetical protein